MFKDIEINNNTNEKFKESIYKILKNTMLAGGYCLSVVQNTTHSNVVSNWEDSIYLDQDFFFETEDEYNKVTRQIDNLRIKEFEEYTHINKSFETDSAVSYNTSFGKIQLIKIFKPFKRTLNEFDIINSMYYSFYPFKEIKFNKSYEKYEKYTKTYILINPSHKLKFGLAKRIAKYNKTKHLVIHKKIIEKIYELFFNYDDDSFSDYDYGNQTITEAQQRKNIIFDVLHNFIGIKEFDEIVIQDEVYKILPFSDYEEILSFHTTADIKTLGYFKYNHIHWNRHQNTENNPYSAWMAEYYPEYLI